MTVTEAALYAKKNPETIRRWIREGKLVARKDDRDDWIIEQGDLKTCLEKNFMTKLAIGAGIAAFPVAGIAALAAGTVMGVAASDKFGDFLKEELTQELQEMEKKREEVEKQIDEKIQELRRLSEDIGLLKATLEKM